MKAVELVRTRVVLSAASFAELVLWRLPKPVSGCAHCYKYRLAYVVRGACVVRYDNEAGKGDHRHSGDVEEAFDFEDPDTLIAAFQADIERWNRENGNA